MNSRKIIRIFSIAIIIFIFFLFVRRYDHPKILKFSREGEFFGASVVVDVCYSKDRLDALKEAMDEVWLRFADIHGRMSVYDPQSDINKINQAYEQPVIVGEDTFALVRDSIEYYKLSDGVFDITVGPLIKLWKEKGRRQIMPDEEEIAAARALAGIGFIELIAPNQIRLQKDELKINIDSIGDGFAADEAARILRRHGFSDFLVDASGELYAGGLGCSGRLWRVGVRDPQNKEGLFDVVEATDLAVSTSGSYERFYEIDGQRWPHIIDPRTGYPSRSILSATVIAPETQIADFLSTALCILEPARGRAVIDSLGDRYASMVIVQNSDGTIEAVQSKNYLQYSKKVDSSAQ